MKETRKFRRKTREVKNKEQTARKNLGSFRRRSKPIERDERLSKEAREIENKEQTARKEFRISSKPLERDWRIAALT